MEKLEEREREKENDKAIRVDGPRGLGRSQEMKSPRSVECPMMVSRVV